MSTRAALETLWRDKLTVIERQKVLKPNKTTGFDEISVMEDVPCKLSFSTLSAARQGEEEAGLVQVTKLFLGNEIKIKPGSKLIVKRGGETFEFGQSGLPGIFSHHQEIVLAPFKEFA